MVVDAKGRATHLRGLPCRPRTLAGERGARRAVENDEAGKHDRSHSDIAKRRPLVFGRIFSILVLSAAVLGQTQPPSTIKFEDATAASGIRFTHSFGSQKLGSLLEG